MPFPQGSGQGGSQVKVLRLSCVLLSGKFPRKRLSRVQRSKGRAVQINGQNTFT